jgi:uncharacterized protein YjbJ (UPF0337 family)
MQGAPDVPSTRHHPEQLIGDSDANDASFYPKEGTMNKDRIKGAGTNVRGKAKEAAGKLTGDSKLQGEGKLDQAKGKVQNTVGGIKDDLKK